jgi:hypothetical protein
VAHSCRITVEERTLIVGYIAWSFRRIELSRCGSIRLLRARERMSMNSVKSTVLWAAPSFLVTGFVCIMLDMRGGLRL